MKIRAVAIETYDSKNIHHLFIKYRNTITRFTLEMLPFQKIKNFNYYDRINIKGRYTETLHNKAEADSKWIKLIDHINEKAMENGMTIKFYSDFNELLVYASDNTYHMWKFTQKLKDYLGTIPFPYEDPEGYLKFLYTEGEEVGAKYHNVVKDKVICFKKLLHNTLSIYIKKDDDGHFRIVRLDYPNYFSWNYLEISHAETKEYANRAEMEKAWGQIVYNIVTYYVQRNFGNLDTYPKTFHNYTDSADTKSKYYEDNEKLLNSIRNYFKEHPYSEQ